MEDVHSLEIVLESVTLPDDIWKTVWWCHALVTRDIDHIKLETLHLQISTHHIQIQHVQDEWTKSNRNIVQHCPYQIPEKVSSYLSDEVVQVLR